MFKNLFLILTILFLTYVPKIYAAECREDCGTIDECQRYIDECEEVLGVYEEANLKNKETLEEFKVQVERLETMIASAAYQVNQLEEEIIDQEADLEIQQMMLGERIKRLYIHQRSFNILTIFFSSENSGSFLRKFFYQQRVANEDKKAIKNLSQELADLKENKKELEQRQNWLASKKQEAEKQVAFLEQEVAKTEDYLDVLSSSIASLTAKQEEFLAEKLDSLNLPESLGAGPLFCVDDREIDPGFSPAFAFFTFGIPHRVGMSQYGAYGRANAGQSYDEILKAYYNFDGYQNQGTVEIKVNNGNGVDQGGIIWTGSLEDYVKRIYEIPASWPLESLKAQAIAARSYALAVTDNGARSICANQYCQVFKRDPKGGAWDQAVNNTAGKVMVVSDQPITAWYASTAGGYTFTNADIWGGSVRSWTKRMRDTTGAVNSFSNLLEKAYDRESPCMYAAQGWRTQYANSAWLKPEEVADIVNVILLARKDSSTQEHLYQTDKPNPEGVETWSYEKVKQEMQARELDPFTTISSVSITGVDWSLGRTTEVSVSGDAGSKSFTGTEFSDFFNLRAPANIQIVGPLFNVEKN